MLIAKHKLTHNLIILFLLTSVIPIAFIGFWSYQSGKESLKTQFLNDFTAIAQAKGQTISQYLDTEVIRIENLAADDDLQQQLLQSEGAASNNEALAAQWQKLIKAKTLSNQADLNHGYSETLVMDANGRVVASTDNQAVGRDESADDLFNAALDGVHIKDVYEHPGSKQQGFAVSAPIRQSGSGKLLGVVANRLTLDTLTDITTNRQGLRETGEAYIVNKNGYMITPSRFIPNAILKQKVDSEPVRLFQTQQRDMAGLYADYRNMPIVGASDGQLLNKRYDLGWLLLVEIDEAEANAEIVQLGNWELLFGLATAAVAAAIGLFYGRMLSRPISQATAEVFTTSSELSITTDEHERTAAQQAVAVNETSATMNELGRSAQQSILQADAASQEAQQVANKALAGATTMQELLTSMDILRGKVEHIGTQILRLSEQTSQIGHITEAVKDIANQTNLLALNAAVEATRAGEHGKGFTVVSQEIRKLAEQSKKSAEHISNLLENIQKVTNTTVLAAEAGTQTAQTSSQQAELTKRSYDELSDAVNNIADVLQQISLTAKQQANATNQVVEAMNMLNTGAKETANGITQSKLAIQNLNKAAGQLQNMI
ncbi:MAG: methyl-accepting chemotaxis protein [Methylovulum sp.]|nr:methyl-accepting chemotaxis protein [Methylovulum sp.]